MSEIVLARLMELCPPKKMDDITIDEIRESVNIAFKIIGYKPIDMDKSIDKALDTSNAEWLYQFVYDVWRCDQ